MSELKEYTAYSHEEQRLEYIRAYTQKEAIKKAVNKHDIIPKRSLDVRPRTGTESLMDRKEFNEFMNAEVV